jgi:hypothetical protein
VDAPAVTKSIVNEDAYYGMAYSGVALGDFSDRYDPAIPKVAKITSPSDGPWRLD